MAKAIMVSIRPEQIDLICGAGARVPVGKGYTLDRRLRQICGPDKFESWERRYAVDGG